MLKRTTDYFDLQSSRKAQMAAAGGNPDGYAPVLPQYLTVSAGVLAEPALTALSNGTSVIAQLDFTKALPVLMALIIGIVLLPSVYRSSFDTDKPVSVQLAALFPMGVGWQSMFSSVVGVAS